MGIIKKQGRLEDLYCCCGNTWLIKCYSIGALPGEVVRFSTAAGAENIRFYCPNCNSVWDQEQLLRGKVEAVLDDT